METYGDVDLMVLCRVCSSEQSEGPFWTSLQPLLSVDTWNPDEPEELDH